MNLLIITPIFPPHTGGPATYVAGLIDYWKVKHQITLISFSSKPKLIKGVKIAGIDTSGNTIWRQLKLMLQVLFHLLGKDAVYVQGPLNVGLIGVFMATILGKKTLVKFVGDEVWEDERLYERTSDSLEDFYSHSHSLIIQLKICLMRLSLKVSPTVIVPSHYLKIFLSHTHRINPKKITVIANAVKVSIGKVKKRPLQLIYIGRLVPWKNIGQIIQAVNLARKKTPWRLLIVGEGPQQAHLKRLVNSIKANSWVTFTGRLDLSDTQKHLAQSQKLILYSQYEGLPHTLIEAMLCKTAIIASDIPSNRETTFNQAVYVPLDQPDKLAQAVNRPSVATLPLYQKAVKVYSWENHLSKLKKLLFSNP